MATEIKGNEQRRVLRTGWPGLGLFLLVLAAGCGGNVSSGDGRGPVSGESTEVTVLVTNMANDQLVSFPLFLNRLTLTSKSGETVSVLSSPQQVEFIHLSGTAEPLATVSVPQDYYTSATAEVGAAEFTCLSEASDGSVETSTVSYGYTPDSNVTAFLPQQITVSGSALGLALILNVSASAIPATCSNGGLDPESWITPAFDLTSFQISTNPASPAEGKLSHLDGIISSVDATDGALTITGNDGLGQEVDTQGNTVESANLVWNVSTDSSTAFQGIAGIGALVEGTAVDVDATLQPSGVLLASRLAVIDPLPNDDLTLQYGPLMMVPIPSLVAGGDQFDDMEQGYLYTINNERYSDIVFGYQNSVFQAARGYSNLGNLPFTPNFSAATMVAGQDVLITTHAASVSFPTSAATYTLMPQTINGTVTVVATSGNFTVYTVTLAPYDLFPALAFTSQYQTSPLTSPDTVYVYTDTSTSMLNTQPAAAGAVLRFTGLVFNDSGTLRMDCSQLMDGVAE